MYVYIYIRTTQMRTSKIESMNQQQQSSHEAGAQRRRFCAVSVCGVFGRSPWCLRCTCPAVCNGRNARRRLPPRLNRQQPLNCVWFSAHCNLWRCTCIWCHLSASPAFSYPWGSVAPGLQAGFMGSNWEHNVELADFFDLVAETVERNIYIYTQECIHIHIYT